MILPFLIPIFKGFQNWIKAPITWSIFSLLVFVQIVFSEQVKQGNADLNKYLTDPIFIKVQARMFANFVLRYKSQYSASLVKMAHESQSGVVDYSLAIVSIKDPRFMSIAPELFVSADPIETQWWQSNVKQIQDIKKTHPHYLFSVNSNNKDLTPWLTYQFVHSGWEHLLINSFFLLIIGAYLERFIGGLLLLITFVFSGFFAAGITLLFTEFTMAPLIGASGSISGLMAFFSLLLWKRKVNFFYMLLIPIRGYTGVVGLPAWVFMVLWVAQDFAGYLSNIEYLGGTAFTAHIGGAICGSIMVVSYILIARTRSKIISLIPFSHSH